MLSKRIPNTNQKYFTQEIIKRIPPLYAQDGKGDDAIVHVKFFLTGSNWTWFITEASAVIDDEYVALKDVKPGDDIEEIVMFGMTHGQFNELGYTHFGELLGVRSPMFRLPVERDLHYGPTRLGDI